MNVIRWNVWEDLILVVDRNNTIEWVGNNLEGAEGYAALMDREFGDTSPYRVMRRGEVLSSHDVRNAFLPLERDLALVESVKAAGGTAKQAIEAIARR
jgi:hypothetical protein